MTNKEAIEQLKALHRCADNISNKLGFAGANSEPVDMAIEALKKQIPKKPKHYGNYNHIYDIAECHCGSTDIMSMTGEKQTYCSRCGQRIDWSE